MMEDARPTERVGPHAVVRAGKMDDGSRMSDVRSQKNDYIRSNSFQSAFPASVHERSLPFTLHYS